MTNESNAPDDGYLISKNGLYYRPECRGYTSTVHEAGRYSLSKAIDLTHPNGQNGPQDGLRYVHESEVDQKCTSEARAVVIAHKGLEKIDKHRRGLQGIIEEYSYDPNKLNYHMMIYYRDLNYSLQQTAREKLKEIQEKCPWLKEYTQ